MVLYRQPHATGMRDIRVGLEIWVGDRTGRKAAQRLASGIQQRSKRKIIISEVHGAPALLLFVLTHVFQVTVLDPTDTVSKQSHHFFDSISNQCSSLLPKP